jgi:hypothetical protein
MQKPAKIADVLKKIKECIDADRYYDTSHAIRRRQERVVSLTEVLYVLRNGRHEKAKDQYKEEHGDWTYAIRGKTIDGDDLRIAVAFDEDGMLIITVIRVDRGLG